MNRLAFLKRAASLAVATAISPKLGAAARRAAPSPYQLPTSTYLYTHVHESGHKVLVYSAKINFAYVSIDMYNVHVVTVSEYMNLDDQRRAVEEAATRPLFAHGEFFGDSWPSTPERHSVIREIGRIGMGVRS